MAFRVFIPPNNSCRIVVRTQELTAVPTGIVRRAVFWSTDAQGNVIDASREFDASTPNALIAVQPYAARPDGRYIYFKAENRLPGGAYVSDTEMYRFAFGHGVGERIVHADMPLISQASILFDVTWPEAELNYLRVLLRRMEVHKISDPSIEHHDEVNVIRVADYPHPLDAQRPRSKQEYRLGSVRVRNYVYPGEGKQLFSGSIGEHVRITIEFEDIDDVWDDRLGIFEVTSLKGSPLAKFRAIESSNVREYSTYETFSLATVGLSGDQGSYTLHLKAISSHQPVTGRMRSFNAPTVVAAAMGAAAILAASVAVIRNYAK